MKKVTTKDELESAIRGRAKKILVSGELAESLNTTLKIKTTSKWAVGLLATALAATPLTGGMSMRAFAPVARLTGIEVTLIIAVVALGLSNVLLICRDFSKVKFKAKKGDAEAELELERN